MPAVLPFTWEDLQGLELPANVPAALEELRCLFRTLQANPMRMSLQDFVYAAFRPYVETFDERIVMPSAKVGHTLFHLMQIVPDAQRVHLRTPFRYDNEWYNEDAWVSVRAWLRAWRSKYTSGTGKNLIPFLLGIPPVLPEC